MANAPPRSGSRLPRPAVRAPSREATPPTHYQQGGYSAPRQPQPGAHIAQGHRQQALDDREADLNDRERAVSEREAACARQAQSLNEREQSLAAQFQQLQYMQMQMQQMQVMPPSVQMAMPHMQMMQQQQQQQPMAVNHGGGYAHPAPRVQPAAAHGDHGGAAYESEDFEDEGGEYQSEAEASQFEVEEEQYGHAPQPRSPGAAADVEEDYDETDADAELDWQQQQAREQQERQRQQMQQQPVVGLAKQRNRLQQLNSKRRGGSAASSTRSETPPSRGGPAHAPAQQASARGGSGGGGGGVGSGGDGGSGGGGDGGFPGGGGAGIYGGGEYDDDDDGTALLCEQCEYCGRKFAPDRLAKHANVCLNAPGRKSRKVFDSKKARLEELEKEAGKPLAKLKPTRGPPAAAATQKKNPKWKSQSEALRNAMKYQRDVAAAEAAGLAPPPPPAVDPDADDRTACPHCSRKFSAKAAERHIPKCQEIRAKPSSLRRGGGNNAAAGARMR